MTADNRNRRSSGIRSKAGSREMTTRPAGKMSRTLSKVLVFFMVMMLLAGNQAVTSFAGEQTGASASAKSTTKNYVAEDKSPDKLDTYYDEDATDDSSNGSDSEDSSVTVTEKKTTDKTRVKGIREDKEELTPEENIKASQKVDAILYWMKNPCWREATKLQRYLKASGLNSHRSVF